MSKILIDQLGIAHTFTTTPKRIVSLVPSQTELLVDLGLEDSIVGITKFCVHPKYLKSKKQIVGGTKNIKLDIIKKLNPDIIICNKEENTQDIVVQLQKICTVWVTDIYTIADNNQMISDFGEIFNKQVNAQNWIDKINFAYADFKNFIKEKPIKKVAYFIWANPYMVAGKNTFITEILKTNRLHNIYENKESRYPEVEIEKIKQEGNPDFILLSSEPFPFQSKHASEIAHFTHHAKIIFVDGEMFSWYGSRVVKAFGYFKEVQLKIR